MSFEPVAGSRSRASSRMGGWVLVVGPSGAGKDTLMAIAKSKLAGEQSVKFARRIVTRRANAFEDHDTISETAFAKLQADGHLAMAWHAHGLSYGIHKQWIDEVEAGAVVVANASRTIVAKTRERFGNVSVVLVTAPDGVLAQRIATRGRDVTVESRGRRDLNHLVHDHADLTISNTGTPRQGAQLLIDHVRQRLAALKQANA